MADKISVALPALKKSKFRSRLKLADKERQYIRDKGIDTIRLFQHLLGHNEQSFDLIPGLLPDNGAGLLNGC